ncbi:MAG TPA: hypothetical protein VMU85_13320 [Stellaceae bacterium]|nr:hypothetical protein [Stellaceae bacterium]
MRANQIKSEQVAGAPATPATFTPATGLGAALAALPPPWAVFRRGGISPFDSTGKEIYGGLYIALHPERGIALVDVAPARPDRAVPRLAGLLRQAGLQEFADAQPPIIALVIGRNELRQAALRLGKAFETAPIIRNHGWTRTAITALLAQFPDLQQVQRAGEAPVGETALEADAATAAAAEAAPPPAAGAVESASAPTAAGYEIPQMPASPAARPEPAQPPQPAAAGTERPSLDGVDPRLDSVDHRIRSFDPEPSFWEEWLPSRRYLPGVVIGVAVIAAVVILLLRSGTPPVPDTGAPTASTGSGETAPAAPAPAPPPEQAATTPPPVTAAPAPPPVPPPADQAATAAPAPSVPAPSAPAASASTPAGSASRTSATPVVPPPASAPPQQTATVPPPASPPPAQALTPPTPPLVKVPPTKEAARPGEPAAKKAAKPKASDTATREDRARKPAEPPAVSPAPSEETVTIDGMTYVKGREPRALGETESPAPDSGATVTPAPQAPPPQDHSQDVTPGSVTISPGGAQGTPP